MNYLKYLFTDWIICHNHIPSFIRRRKARKLRNAEIARIQKEREEKLRETQQLGFSFYAGIVNEIYNYKILSIVLQPLPSYKSDAIDMMIKESKNVKVQSPEVLQ